MSGKIGGVMFGLWFALLPSARAELTLVLDHQPRSAIVISKKALPWQRAAAEELRYHIKRISEAELPLLSDAEYKDDGHTPAILVGQSQAVAALGINTEKLKRETFIVKTIGNKLVLAGEDGWDGTTPPENLKLTDTTVRTGTLFAVYDFLQDQLGCRWIWPGKSGEVIPSRATIVIPDLDLQETPLLFQRHMRLVLDARHKDEYARKLQGYLDVQSSYDQASAEEAQWFKRMRLGRSMYIAAGHSFTKWWEKYHATHPDIFAQLPDGRRGYIGTPETVKMCVANPKLWELQLEEYRQGYARQPELFRALRSCENDGNEGFCHCERCRAWDWQPTEEEYARLEKEGWDIARLRRMVQIEEDGLPQRLSHRYCRWWNELARRVREINPDALVTGYAYNRYSTPPIGMKMEPNVFIPLVSGDIYPKTPEEMEAGKRLLKQWQLTGASLAIRPNSLYFGGHSVPYIFTHQIAEDFKNYIAAGVRSTDFDSLMGYWATTGPTYYVLARLHWDTHLSSDAILEQEYYPSFGPMAPVVKEYFDYWERFTMEKWAGEEWRKQAKELSPTSNTRARVMLCGEYYTSNIFDKARAILDKATPLMEKATEGEQLRFENILLGLRHAELTARSIANARRIQLANPPHGAIDIREAAATVQELVKLRRQIALRHVTNVFMATRTELRLYYWVNRIHMARELGDRTGIYLLKDSRWRIRLDPEEIGKKESWATHSEALRQNWGHAVVREGYHWGRTQAGELWKKERGEEYKGTAWYMIEFPAPQKSEGRRLGILLASVRGDAEAWINGRHLGESPQPEEAQAIRAAEFMIPDELLADKNWQLLIRIKSPIPQSGLCGWTYVFER